MAALSISSRISLLDGLSIPAFGLGFFLSDNHGEAEEAGIHAVKIGYRLLDTATLYDNEEDVGKVIRKCGLPRDELYVTTKLWYTDHGKERARSAFHESLKKLGLKYVDLYLIHSPSGGKILETWDAIVELQKEGFIKSIGVSNFNIHHLEKLIEARPHAIPVVNQVEISPFLTREALVEYCRSKNIVVEAYSPLTKGKFLNDPTLVAMAQRYGKSSAQLLIRWSLQRGYVCIPKSSKKERITQNADIFDFTISPDDMATMNGWNRNSITSWNVIESPWKP
jgi:diketogulonate reductase-like aldo/keto reductase